MAKPTKIVDVADSYAVRLMQHLVVPTFVIDPKRRVVIWNRACERLTGVAASEVIGTTKHWQALYAAKRLGRNRVICGERLLAEFGGLGRDPLPVPAPARRKSA